jgi:hypothetical protein
METKQQKCFEKKMGKKREWKKRTHCCHLKVLRRQQQRPLEHVCSATLFPRCAGGPGVVGRDATVNLAPVMCQMSSVTTRYGLPHYAHMIRRTCYFSLCLLFSSSPLCLIRMDKLTTISIPSLVRYVLSSLRVLPCSNYVTFLVASYSTPLFSSVYKGMY